MSHVETLEVDGGCGEGDQVQFEGDADLGYEVYSLAPVEEFCVEGHAFDAGGGGVVEFGVGEEPLRGGLFVVGLVARGLGCGGHD